jgi:hypothetical protein
MTDETIEQKFTTEPDITLTIPAPVPAITFERMEEPKR